MFVSHRLDEVSAHADAVTVLRDGHRSGGLQRADISESRLAELIAGSVPERRTGSAPERRTGSVPERRTGAARDARARGERPRGAGRCTE